MQNVVQHGTGLYAQLPGRPVAGKTGTADKSKDIWFVGFTPDTCTAVWGGNDHNKGINNMAVTGGMVMAGMWKKYMLAYYGAHPTPAGSFMQRNENATQIAMSTDDASAARSKGIVPVNSPIGNNDSANDKLTKSQNNSKTANGNNNKPEIASGNAKDDNDATADNDAKDDQDAAKSQAALTSKDGVSNYGATKQNSKRSRKMMAKQSVAADKSDDDKKASETTQTKDNAAVIKDDSGKAAADEQSGGETGASADKQSTDEKTSAGEHAAGAEHADSADQAVAHEQAAARAQAQRRSVARRQAQGPKAVYVRMPNGQIYLMPVRNGRVMMPGAAPPAAAPAAAAPAAAAPAAARPADEPENGED